MTEQTSTPRRRARRVVAALAIAGTVAVGVSACQVQPGAAGFVANERITQDQVDTVVKSVVDGLHGKLPTNQYGGLRQNVAAYLVMHDLAKRVAADRHVTVDPPNYEALAKRTGLPADNKYVRLETETDNYIAALRAAAARTKPSEKDLQEIYQALVNTGLDPSQLPYSVARKQLLQTPDVGKAISLRNTLVAATRQYHVDLSPQYGQVGFPITAAQTQSQASGSVAVPLGKGSPKVVVTPSAGDITALS